MKSTVYQFRKWEKDKVFNNIPVELSSFLYYIDSKFFY